MGDDATTVEQLRAELAASRQRVAELTAEVVALRTENDLHVTERDDALEQQTATGGVLRAVASSTTDLQSVFQEIAESARRLCEGRGSLIFLRDGEMLRIVAADGSAVRGDPIGELRPVNSGSRAAQALLEHRVVHVQDVQSAAARAAYPDDLAGSPADNRTVLTVPILQDAEAIGILSVSREVTQRFTERQIALLETFADQAAMTTAQSRSAWPPRHPTPNTLSSPSPSRTPASA